MVFAKMTLHIFRFFLLGVLFWGHGLWAQSSSSGYSLEVAGIYGVNLPHSMPGHEGTFQVLGLRAASALGEGALEAGLLFHHADPDRIYTLDAGYRHILGVEGLNLMVMGGLHFSKFSVSEDLDEDGVCVETNCPSTSGFKVGLYAGTGLQLMLGPHIPLTFAGRFYVIPSIWLLLELGLGYRF